VSAHLRPLCVHDSNLWVTSCISDIPLALHICCIPLLYTPAVTHPIFACHAAPGAVRAVAGGNRIGSQPDHVGGGQDSGFRNSIAVMLLGSQQQGLGSARHLGRCAIINSPCCAMFARRAQLTSMQAEQQGTAQPGLRDAAKDIKKVRATLSFFSVVSSKGWSLPGVWAGEASTESHWSVSLSERKLQTL